MIFIIITLISVIVAGVTTATAENSKNKIRRNFFMNVCYTFVILGDFRVLSIFRKPLFTNFISFVLCGAIRTFLLACRLPTPLAQDGTSLRDC